MQLEPLPRDWLDRVFGRLMVRYGDSWVRMWTGFDMEKVKADWCEVLANVHKRPEALRYALENLPPDRPPNAAQFKELCNRAPTSVRRALPEPVKINHRAVAELRAKVGLDEAVKRVETQADEDRRMTYAQRQVLAAVEARKRALANPAPSHLPELKSRAWPDPGPLPWPKPMGGAEA